MKNCVPISQLTDKRSRPLWNLIIHLHCHGSTLCQAMLKRNVLPTKAQVPFSCLYRSSFARLPTSPHDAPSPQSIPTPRSHHTTHLPHRPLLQAPIKISMTFKRFLVVCTFDINEHVGVTSEPAVKCRNVIRMFE